MPAETCSGPGFTMWHSDFGAIVEADIGKDEWAAFRAQADQRYGHAGSLRKNALHIGASLALASEVEMYSTGLIEVCSALLEPQNFES